MPLSSCLMNAFALSGTGQTATTKCLFSENQVIFVFLTWRPEFPRRRVGICNCWVQCWSITCGITAGSMECRLARFRPNAVSTSLMKNWYRMLLMVTMKTSAQGNRNDNGNGVMAATTLHVSSITKGSLCLATTYLCPRKRLKLSLAKHIVVQCVAHIAPKFMVIQMNCSCGNTIDSSASVTTKLVFSVYRRLQRDKSQRRHGTKVRERDSTNVWQSLDSLQIHSHWNNAPEIGYRTSAHC